VSELYSGSADAGSDTTSETSTATRTEREPAPDSAGHRQQDSSMAERQDDAAIEARLDEADLPTRAESRAATWGPDATDDDDFDFGDEYDGELQALLAAHENGLPTRAESRAATWGPDATDEDGTPGFGPESGDAAIEATLDEADLPTRAESRAAPGGPAATSDGPDGTELAAEYDGDLSAFPATPASVISDVSSPATTDASSEQPGDLGEQPSDARPETGPPPGAALELNDKDQRDALAATQSGHELSITVMQAEPEDRTLGDTTPTGIGLKPTGDQLLGMENDDPAESRADRFLGKAFERVDDLHDAAGSISEAVEADLGPKASAHSASHIGYTIQEQPPPESPIAGDAVGDVAVFAVAAAVAVRYVLRHLRKEHEL